MFIEGIFVIIVGLKLEVNDNSNNISNLYMGVLDIYVTFVSIQLHMWWTWKFI